MTECSLRRPCDAGGDMNWCRAAGYRYPRTRARLSYNSPDDGVVSGHARTHEMSRKRQTRIERRGSTDTRHWSRSRDVRSAGRMAYVSRLRGGQWWRGRSRPARTCVSWRSSTFHIRVMVHLKRCSAWRRNTRAYEYLRCRRPCSRMSDAAAIAPVPSAWTACCRSRSRGMPWSPRSATSCIGANERAGRRPGAQRASASD